MALHTRKLLVCGCLPQQLERFMRGESPRDECRLVVRHLLTRCPECMVITRRCGPDLEQSAADGVPEMAPGRRPAVERSPSNR